MSFSKITNPLTNQTFSIFSIEGKNLLKNYVKMYNNGGMNNDDKKKFLIARMFLGRNPGAAIKRDIYNMTKPLTRHRIEALIDEFIRKKKLNPRTKIYLVNKLNSLYEDKIKENNDNKDIKNDELMKLFKDKITIDGQNNIDCVNCEECENCVNCKDCEGCEDCEDCNNCFICIGCRDCNNCNNCDNCLKCYGCNYCGECENCKDCDNCKNCENSDNCKNCENCDNCKNCENCDNCKNCKNKSDLKNEDCKDI